MRARMSWPPPLAMLAPELCHVCSAEETARVLAILGAHRCSVIGELPDKARTVVLEIMRNAKARRMARAVK